MLYRTVSDVHSEFWPENQAKARTLADRRIPLMDGDPATILLLPGDTGSYKRRNIYRWLIERLAEPFLAVYDIPGNHYAYCRTDWNVCDSPAPDLDSYRFSATLVDETVSAATLWADFQRENPVVEVACRVGMNDFRQINGTTPARVEARHREHLAFLEAEIRTGGIVMMHFSPSWQSFSPEYGGSELTGYNASELKDLILRKHPPPLGAQPYPSSQRLPDRRQAGDLQSGRL